MNREAVVAELVAKLAGVNEIFGSGAQAAREQILAALMGRGKRSVTVVQAEGDAGFVVLRALTTADDVLSGLPAIVPITPAHTGSVKNADILEAFASVATAFTIFNPRGRDGGRAR